MNRETAPIRTPKAPRAAPRGRALLIRRRFQFAGALLFGAILPWMVRGPLLPGTMFEPASVNTVMKPAA